MIELDALLLTLGTPPSRARGRWLRAGLLAAIVSGALASGDQLPGARSIARTVGMARGTVTEALDRLVEEGRLEVAARRGYFVAPGQSEPLVRPIPGPTEAPRHSPGVGDLALFPRAEWLRSVKHALTHLPDRELGYTPTSGLPSLRQTLAGYLARTRGARVDSEMVVVVGGVAQALSLIARVGHRAGLSRWSIELPHPPGVAQLLRHHGCEIAMAPVDDDGVILDDVGGPGFLLLTPAHQAPTGVRLSAARRQEVIVKVAQEGLVVVEDDYDGDLPLSRDRVAVLQAAAPHDVLLLGSVSKSMAPGLRLGWVVAPHEWARALAAERGMTDLGSPVLDQAALAHFIDSGAYDRHLRRVRKEYAARRHALVIALERVGLQPSSGTPVGLHVFAACSETDAMLAQVSLTRAGFAAQAVTGSRPGLLIGTASVPAYRAPEVVQALSGR